MGMFNDVEFEDGVLPEKYVKLKGWQTKSEHVVPLMLHTLIIKLDKKIYHHWRELLPNENFDPNKSILDNNPLFKSGDEHLDELNFHGIMEFHTYDMRTRFSGFAKFTDGLLESIDIYESEF